MPGAEPNRPAYRQRPARRVSCQKWNSTLGLRSEVATDLNEARQLQSKRRHRFPAPWSAARDRVRRQDARSRRAARFRCPRAGLRTALPFCTEARRRTRLVRSLV